ncbi:heavy-metal-associated domain-containing protein [Collinsella tanakaei]|nr:heavy-metal-associated domain-containing protein [Collinsella tanakaei]
MGDIFTPGNIIVFIVVAIGLVVGIRRAVGGLTKGQSCCTDGDESRKVRAVKITDTDEAHYPYVVDLPIGGMSCQGCADNVTHALNGVAGTWATVDLGSKTAHVRSKNPIDEAAYEAAVRDAGYYVIKL